MSEYENQRQETRAQGNQQGKRPPDGRLPESSDALETDILARLGLLKQKPNARISGSWQQRARNLIKNLGKESDWKQRVLLLQTLAEETNKVTDAETDRLFVLEEVVDAIDQRLRSDKHSAVRMAAVRALGKISLALDESVTWTPFMSALSDGEPEVQATTVDVLMSFVQERGPEELPGVIMETLEKKLRQVSQEDRARRETPELVCMTIIQLLGLQTFLLTQNKQTDPQRGKATEQKALQNITLLLTQLTDRSWQIREATLFALAPLGGWLSQDELRTLSVALYDDNAFVRKAAIVATRKWWPFKHLLADLSSEDDAKQENAIRVLGQWDMPEPQIAQALLPFVTDNRAGKAIREAALKALTQLVYAFRESVIDETTIARLRHQQDQNSREAGNLFYDIFHSENVDESAQAIGTGDYHGDDISSAQKHRKDSQSGEEESDI